MEDKNSQSVIKNLLESAKSIIVVLPPDPTSDMVAAGISLHLSLKESGKNSQIGCGSDLEIDPQIEGVTEIPNTIGSRNLIISFDYKEDDLDKVDYDTREDGKFYLVVKPKTDAPAPDISNVHYSYSGASADLIITLGVTTLQELGKIYAEEKQYLDNVEAISLNTTLRPSAFTGNAVHKLSGSFSELVAGLIENLKLKTTPALANNLLTGIYSSTKGLTTGRLSADTFGSVAFLMRSGAQLPSQPVSLPNYSQPPFFETPQAVEEDPSFQNREEDSIPSDWNKPKVFRVTGNE